MQEIHCYSYYDLLEQRHKIEWAVYKKFYKDVHLFRDFDYSSAAGEELYLVILLYSLSCSFPASVALSPAIFTVPWKQYKSSESPLQL